MFISPASRGSLGDQALVEGFLELQNNTETKCLEALVINGQVKQKIYAGSLPVLGRYQSSRSGILNIIFDSIRYKALYIIGADTLDGSYDIGKNLFWLDIANYAVKVGIPVNIISFSFSSNPDLRVVKKIHTIDKRVVFVSREVYSKERFEFTTGVPCILAADLAFIMKEKKDNKEIISVNSWVEDRKSSGDKVVALNVNSLTSMASLSTIVDNYIGAISSFENKNISFLLVSHDFRDDQSDYEVLSLIYEGVRKRGSSIPMVLVGGPYNCWDAKYAVSSVDFIVTGRMHLAIAGLSQGIPVYCVSYKDKFEGLLHHFGLKNCLIKSSDLLSLNKIVGLFDFALSNFKSDKVIVNNSLQKVIKLSASNIIN
ncbi:MAG: polysaccharide pyruvyl transferase family protein [Motiliproteus sp.]